MEDDARMGYDLNLIDAGLIPLVIVIVQYLKKRVHARWVPILPFPVSAALSALAVIGAAGGWPGWPAFLAQTTVQTLKVAFAAMGLFKIYWTTVLGKYHDEERGGRVMSSSLIGKLVPWVLAAVLAAAVVFMGVKWYRNDRLLREALEARDRAEQAMEGMKSVEEQVKLIWEQMRELDEKQAEIDERVRERDKKLEELERRTQK